MNAVMDNLNCVRRQTQPGLLFDGSVYYAEVSHPASDLPIRVALHGVLTSEAASEALSVLSGSACLCAWEMVDAFGAQ